MSKASRLVQTLHITRASRPTHLRVIRSASGKGSVKGKVEVPPAIRWKLIFHILRVRMSRQCRLAPMPRAVWRRR